MERRPCAYKSMREVQAGRVRRTTQMYKPLTQNILAECLVWYFDPGVIPGTSHKLRSFRAGLYWVMKIIAPALTEIKLVHYQGEERWVSLDVLKMF